VRLRSGPRTADFTWTMQGALREAPARPIEQEAMTNVFFTFSFSLIHE
jgi:hypothetical protein